MRIHFIKSSQKKKILHELNEQFGIASLPYLLVESGKEKLRAFSGSLSKEEIFQLNQITNIEAIGLYMLKKEQDFRLTIDATHLLKEQIIKNIVQINDEQLNDWLKGQDLEIQSSNETKIIQHKEDFIGSGKSNGKKIFNYIPKERRLRK